jgi:hypothetical protein
MAQVKIKSEQQKFEPVVIEITLESKEEVQALLDVSNLNTAGMTRSVFDSSRMSNISKENFTKSWGTISRMLFDILKSFEK